MNSSFVAPPAERTEPPPRADAADPPPNGPAGSRFADLLQQRRDAAAHKEASIDKSAADGTDASARAANTPKSAPPPRAKPPEADDAPTADERPAATADRPDTVPDPAKPTDSRKAPPHGRTDRDDPTAATLTPVLAGEPATGRSRAAGSGDDSVATPNASTRSVRTTATGDAPAGEPAAGTDGAPAAATSPDAQAAIAVESQAPPGTLPRLQADASALPALPAPVAHAASVVGSAAPAAAVLAAPLHAPEFAQVLGAQVSLFARDGLQQAELRLNPPEMGPIGVRIDLDGSSARVSFHAAQAATRDVIERALPELAAALRSEGLTLAGGGVYDGSSGARAAFTREVGPPPSNGARQGASATPAMAATRALHASQGVLDLYA